MAETWTAVTGQLNKVSWGGTDLGSNNAVDIPELYDLEAVIPDSMGGEPLTYLLKKKEILVMVTFSESNADVFATAMGGFTNEISDSELAGLNVGADADWTKALVITPKVGATSGQLTFTMPYAIPIGKWTNLGTNKANTTTIAFRAIRGAGDYSAKMERAA